MLSLPAIL